MKITIVMGFFLPVPPVAGGAVEKSWHRLTREFARRGHAVTLVSRRWLDWPAAETVDGVHYLRLSGFDHKKRLWQNLLCDFLWSWRVHLHLPDADIVLLNTISLACWLGPLRPRAGRIVVMPGRMPKGQFRLYRRPARILVPSSPVQEAVILEKPAFASLVRTIGYPIDWDSLSAPRTQANEVLTIGYVGRLHREKGVDMLAAALRHLESMDLPPWRAVICGPIDLVQGGSGEDYLQSLREGSSARVKFLGPIFEESELHALYRQFDLFCYPSLADRGETFGVAVAEAMAAGAVPVVSDLPCFRDFISPGINGLTFDATAPDAIAQLTTHLAALLRDTSRRKAMGVAAQKAVQPYDYGRYAESLLTDFAQLTAPSIPLTSVS
jgi:glycosyltransferase involved in cell wall biosynthesis